MTATSAVTKKFCSGHASHSDWRMACEIALAQIDGQLAQTGYIKNPTLGFIYVTENFSSQSQAIIEFIKAHSKVSDWVGAVGMGICTTSAEYYNEPAIALMLSDLAPNQYRVFSGRKRAPPLGERSSTGAMMNHTAVVHADPSTADLQELINEVANRTDTGFLFGGVTSNSHAAGQFANDSVTGGVSGAMFSSDVAVLTRITQGCSPLGKEHRVSSVEGNYLKALDERPALDVMLSDLGIEPEKQQSRDGREILKLIGNAPLQKGLLIGVAPKGSDVGGKPIGFGDYVVRHVVGIDPVNRIVAVGDYIQEDDRAVFCTRDAAAARRDLIRICAEMREESEEQNLAIQGGLYFSCVARGANTFGEEGAEMGIIRHNLGDIPIVGFYANGEIARNKLYGYTGVLTLFMTPNAAVPA